MNWTSAPQIAAALLAAPLAVAVHAAPAAALVPGTDLTVGGEGILTVTSEPGSDGRYAIDGGTPDLFTCTVRGVVHDRVSHPQLDDGTTAAACTVRFMPTAEGIVVDVDPADVAACHDFCGANAWFADTYLIQPAPCAQAERDRSDAAFLAAYKARKYAGALAVIEPVLKTCGRFLVDEDDGWLRSNVAITLYHLHRHADCRAALKPFIDRYGADAAELHQAIHAHEEFDAILPIARAVWHNDKLCAQP